MGRKRGPRQGSIVPLTLSSLKSGLYSTKWQGAFRPKLQRTFRPLPLPYLLMRPFFLSLAHACVDMGGQTVLEQRSLRKSGRKRERKGGGRSGEKGAFWRFSRVTEFLPGRKREAGGKKVSYNRVIAAHALREGKERERKKLKKLWVVPAAPWRWSRATSRSPTS